MVRGSKKAAGAAAAVAAADPEVQERSRLKKLAFSRNILSQDGVKVSSSAALGPSKTVMKHHGRDILRKSQRKNRYLFSFPGLLGPISGGKIGELKDLGTKNPILYLDFPQGQMKLFGTIVYPKNRYLTLQFSKGGKNVTCDDYFDNMIVFSDAWWIGTKEENPEELQLEFPKELNKEKHAESEFKGGAGGGAATDCKQSSGKPAMKSLEREHEKVLLEDGLTDTPNDCKELAKVTPAHPSAKAAGKMFKFAEPSGDDFIKNVDATPEKEDDKVDNETLRVYTSTKTEFSPPSVFEGNNDDAATKNPASGRYKRTGQAKDPSDNQHTPLVQTTLSSLFKKVEEKKMKKAEDITTTSEPSKPIKRRKKTEEKKSGTVTKDSKKQHKDCKGETSGREKRIKKESALAASDSVTQMVKTLDSRQQKLFFDVFRDYRDGKLDHDFIFLPREYSAAQFWIILGRVFDERAKARRLDPIALGDLILFGNKLEKDFIKARNKGIEYISPILGEIFSPCDDCQRKIPVFPKCVLEQLGYRTPTRARSRSASASASASGSGSGASIESARQSQTQSAEISDSRLELIIKIRESEARNEITMSEMMKLVDMVNKWEENVGWTTLLLSAQTHDQFVKYMKGVLDHHLSPN